MTLSLPSPIIVFNIICYVAYHSAAKFTLPIEQPSILADKWQMRHHVTLETLSETENLGCCSNIATIIFTFSFGFILIIPRLPFKCQGHPISLWHWPLTGDLKNRYLLRSSLGMHNLERRLRYSLLLTRHCPCNLLPQPTSSKHEYRGLLWGHPVTSSMTSSPGSLMTICLFVLSYYEKLWQFIYKGI